MIPASVILVFTTFKMRMLNRMSFRTRRAVGLSDMVADPPELVSLSIRIQAWEFFQCWNRNSG